MKTKSTLTWRCAQWLVCVTLLSPTLAIAQSATSLRFYAHPGFEYYSNRSQNASSPYFRGGPLVFFVTSQISDRVSVAGEMNMHYMATTGAEVELERMYLRYDWRNALHVTVGRMYSPIGFWNVNYNFGLVLQPNISRPRILNPTHDGGFILTRETGVQIGGDNIGKAGFFYRFLVANGIGKNGGLLGTPYLLGPKVSLTGQVGLEPVEGLRFSVSAVTNSLPDGSLTQFEAPVPEALTSRMVSASVSHMAIDKKLEFIGEYYVNTHDYVTLPDQTLNGAILYLGYKATTKVVPYFFAELLSFPAGDPYYPTVNPYTNQPYVGANEYNLGLRYRVNANLVLKGEAALLDQEQFGTSYGFKTQVAFGF